MPEFPEVNLQIGYLRERCIGWRTQCFGLTGRIEHFINIPVENRANDDHGYNDNHGHDGHH